MTTAIAFDGCDTAALDQILAFQLLVAWAGESESEPPRLAWWRTALADQFGGEDLFRRLLPHTWAWAVLEGARAAAKRVDARGRERTADADQLVSLFRLGFVLDEQLDDRLRDLKRAGVAPAKALPALKPLAQGWSRPQFEAWLADLPEAGFTQSPSGRRLKDPLPKDPVAAARTLCSAFVPLSEIYPAPHYRVGR